VRPSSLSSPHRFTMDITTEASSAVDECELRRNVALNQFAAVAGCDRQTAERCLVKASWQFQVIELLLLLLLLSLKQIPHRSEPDRIHN
jgi:hypothetical protein